MPEPRVYGYAAKSPQIVVRAKYEFVKAGQAGPGAPELPPPSDAPTKEGT